MTTAFERPNPELDQLKHLLFQNEAEKLALLQETIDQIHERVGTQRGLEIAMAEVLVRAFRRAEVDAPLELAAVVAPTVVSAIRNEIKNSRGLMIEALYPITGRLVAAAVAHSFKDLVTQLQLRIDALTSLTRWRWRIESWITGRPIGEVAIAKSDMLVVRRLLIIERESGRLLGSWTSEDASDDDYDLVSGMISAIMGISVQALTGAGELRALDFGGREIALRASAHTIFAVECEGTVRLEDRARIDSAFLNLIEDLDSGVAPDAQFLAKVAAAFQRSNISRATTVRGRRTLIALAVLSSLFILWEIVNIGIRWNYERRVENVFQTTVASLPVVQPSLLRIKFDHPGQSVLLTGISPSRSGVGVIQENLKKVASPYNLENQVTIVPSQDDVVALQTKLQELESEQAQSRKNIANEIEEQQHKYTELSDTISKINTPLDRFISSTAVFFDRGEVYLNPEKAAADIRKLAGLLKNSAVKIRVVGYADPSGSSAINSKLARLRAERVVNDLVREGIAADRLTAVSRSSSMPIAETVDGIARENRRVTFEKVYLSEGSR